MSMTGRRRRYCRRALLATIIVFFGFTGRLFVWPPSDLLRTADAIVVLGGDGQRLSEGLTLASEHYAPLLLVSTVASSPFRACGHNYDRVRVICFVPNPFSTQGEARSLGAVAGLYHLRDVLLVSGTAQELRARLRVERCYHGRVTVIGVTPSNPLTAAYDVVYEWGALLKALTWQRSC